MYHMQPDIAYRSTKHKSTDIQYIKQSRIFDYLQNFY